MRHRLSCNALVMSLAMNARDVVSGQRIRRHGEHCLPALRCTLVLYDIFNIYVLDSEKHAPDICL